MYPTPLWISNRHSRVGLIIRCRTCHENQCNTGNKFPNYGLLLGAVNIAATSQIEIPTVPAEKAAR